MKIALVAASNGFQAIEYNVPKNLFENEGFSITTASDKKGTIQAHDGSTSIAEKTVDQIDVQEYDAVVFVGGPGALEHLDNITSYTLAQQAYEAQKVVAAICISTRVLAKSGILDGKNATGWDGDSQLQAIYTEHDVNYKPQDVIVDENIITAVGPSAAREFAENIISVLLKKTNGRHQAQ